MRNTTPTITDNILFIVTCESGEFGVSCFTLVFLLLLMNEHFYHSNEYDGNTVYMFIALRCHHSVRRRRPVLRRNSRKQHAYCGGCLRRIRFCFDHSTGECNIGDIYFAEYEAGATMLDTFAELRYREQFTPHSCSIGASHPCTFGIMTLRFHQVGCNSIFIFSGRQGICSN